MVMQRWRTCGEDGGGYGDDAIVGGSSSDDHDDGVVNFMIAVPLLSGQIARYPKVVKYGVKRRSCLMRDWHPVQEIKKTNTSRSMCLYAIFFQNIIHGLPHIL